VRRSKRSTNKLSDARICRSKAVADGAVSFRLEHFVSMRVARTTLGTDCGLPFDSTNPQHLRRIRNLRVFPSGNKYVPDAFDVILAKVRA
jgi:hypothetical protein